MKLESGLYVTATPIGNLKDVTYRAIEIMHGADVIACEDTRHTARLCAAYGVETPRIVYNDHSDEGDREKILGRIAQGGAVCLVSDAGTPAISDPGFKLVRAARSRGLPVFAAPGACAAIAALSICSAPTDAFFFAGFPPASSAARKTLFRKLAPTPATIVFYEGASRVAATLADLAEVFPDRRGSVARELTKRHEDVVEGDFAALSQAAAGARARGEFVILVHPGDGPRDISGLDDFLRAAMATASLKDAAQAAADAFSIPKKQAYDRALAIKGGAA